MTNIHEVSSDDGSNEEDPNMKNKIPDLLKPLSTVVPNYEEEDFRTYFRQNFRPSTGYQYDPTIDEMQYFWKRGVEAWIRVAVEAEKSDIRYALYENRAKNEDRLKKGFYEFKREYNEAPIEMARANDSTLYSFRIVRGTEKNRRTVVQTPNLFFTRVLPIENVDTPSIFRLSWDGCEKPQYLIGDKISSEHMIMKLAPHIKIHASSNNKKEVVSALFSFLRDEARTRVIYLHRFKGFNPDDHGGYIFVNGDKEMTIQGVIENG